MNKAIIILLISATVLSSCVRTEKIDNFPVEKPKIVVNSFLKNNEPIEFFLSKSLSSIDNAKIKKIPNAEIKIFENDILIETINQESTNPTGSNLDAYYVSTVKPKIGKHYKISASVYNLATVTAESDLPPELKDVTAKINKLDTTIYIFSKMFGNEDSAKYNVNIRECSILLNIPDMANVKNYYKIILKAEEKYWNGIKWDYRYRNVYLNN
ncbi:MAG: DUF4249 family protein, partial [Bacteroidia bacterium]